MMITLAFNKLIELLYYFSNVSRTRTVFPNMKHFAFVQNLYNLKKMKNTHRGVLLLVKLQASVCNFTRSNTPIWVFFTFLKLYKWYQIAHSITFQFANFSNLFYANDFFLYLLKTENIRDQWLTYLVIYKPFDSTQFIRFYMKGNNVLQWFNQFVTM